MKTPTWQEVGAADTERKARMSEKQSTAGRTGIPDPGRESAYFAALERTAPGGTTVFTFEGHAIRALLIEGDPWFVAGDIARALGYRDAHNMGRRLDADDKGTHSLSTPGGAQTVAIISEPGLYVAILGSQVEGAIKFKRWVTREVLPAIRRAGSYSAAPPSEDEIVHQALAITARRVEQLTERVAELEPKAEFYDELMDADGTYPYGSVAKMLGWGRNVMLRDLRRAGVLQRNNLPYRRYEHHFKVTPQTYINRKTGETVPTATATVRPSGIAFLRKRLARIADLELVDAE